MSSSGYLVHPTVDPSREKIWTETWKRIDRFLPDLRKELDLDPKTVVVPQQQQQGGDGNGEVVGDGKKEKETGEGVVTSS